MNEERGTSSDGVPVKRRPCPYVKSPREECYCFTMSSLKAQAAVHYCGGNYRACELFREFRREAGARYEAGCPEDIV